MLVTDGTTGLRVLTGHKEKVSNLVPRLWAARQWWRSLGPRAVWQLGAGHAAAWAGGKGHRMYVRPSLDDMLTAGGGRLHLSAQNFVWSLGWESAEFVRLQSEYGEVCVRLAQQYDTRRDLLSFPPGFRVQDATALFLYVTVRLLRPEVVVETGVADGHSSFVILAALDRNAKGTLHSFDIDARAGALVGTRSNWSLTILPEHQSQARFANAISELGQVDLFFHDADHRYLSQLFEYRTVWPAIRNGGVLASDDVDDSRAFFDFSAEVGRQPRLLFDQTKVVGAHRVT